MGSSSTRYALAALFLGLGVLGGYCTIGTMVMSGSGDVYNDITAGSRAGLRGAPEPFKRRYLGVPALDNQLMNLVLFFTSIVDGAVPPENTLTYIWAMAQFFMGWTIFLLEGVRAGNRGRAVSWVGTFGFIVNNIAWATSVPLYLALHVLTSPVARLNRGDGAHARASLFAFLWDMALIPLTVTVSAIAPAVIMSYPSFGNQSSAMHYSVIAIWQFFPLINRIMLEFFHRLGAALLGPIRPTDENGERTTLGKAYLVGVAGVYQFIMTFSAAIHLPILALALLPGPLRQTLAAQFPKYAPYIERGTFANVFVPNLPWAAPKVHRTGYAEGDLAPTAAQFLHYDMYVAFVAMLIWAVYLRQLTAKKSDFGSVVRKVGTWMVLGGLYAPIAALLWDRDEVVLENEAPVALAKKKN